MDTVLWIVQIFLAVGFLGAGAMKLVLPKKKLEPQMPFVADYSDTQVKLIGGAEVAGAGGIVIPALIAPIAATGLVLLMLGAAGTHARRHEPANIVINIFLGSLAAFVVWGRFGPHSF